MAVSPHSVRYLFSLALKILLPELVIHVRCFGPCITFRNFLITRQKSSSFLHQVKSDVGPLKHCIVASLVCVRTVHLYRIAAAWPACENLGEGCSCYCCCYCCCCYCYRAKVRSIPRFRLGWEFDNRFQMTPKYSKILSSTAQQKTVSLSFILATFYFKPVRNFHFLLVPTRI